MIRIPVIANGRPIPRGPGRPAKYPWKHIEVGESFFVPGRTAHDMHSCAHYQKPLKFRCRTITRKDVVGVKVTRVA
jgi:hypothetical protein